MQQNTPNMEIPDYDKSLGKKDFFPKIFLTPQEVRLDKGTQCLIFRKGINCHQKKLRKT